MRKNNAFTRFCFNQFRKNEIKLHELNYLFWECTRRCNLKCLHCGSDCEAEYGIPDMPFDDFYNAALPLIDIYGKNTITAAITGGEPLLRKDLASCGEQLRKAGFFWGIVTNALLYSKEKHTELLNAGMGSITVSLDGLRGSHTWLRANAKVFDKAINAINLISAERSLNYDVVTCVHKKNIYELPRIKELLLSLNVMAWRLFVVDPIGRAPQNELLTLNTDETKALWDFIADCRAHPETCVRKDGGSMNVMLYCGAYTGADEGYLRDSFFFCRAGVHIASILIDGSISACPNINRHFVQGNIYRDNLPEVWEQRFDVMRNRSWTKTGACKTCREWKHCLGGPMHLWNEKQDAVMHCVLAAASSCRS
ncbi:MAG: radical SAM protein [Spirochaetaceae bacterium]|jgi:radical SAM enzyme (rSAM/lipoprotein system)|nr:radical SAM protein [Spirochaetaceae bacterium]